MTTPIWGKPKAKKGMDLFWGLPDSPKSKYPYNERRLKKGELARHIDEIESGVPLRTIRERLKDEDPDEAMDYRTTKTKAKVRADEWYGDQYR